MNFLLLNHTIAMALTFLTAFFVGIFVLFKGRDKKINLAYSAWSLSVAWWSFFMVMLFVFADTEAKAVFFVHLVWVPVLLIAVSTAHFVTLFLNINIKVNKIFINIGYVLCVFFGIMSLTPYMVKEVGGLAYLTYWPNSNFLVLALFLIFVIYAVYQLYQLFIAYRAATGIKHNQIGYVFWASLLGYTGGLSNFLLVFGIYTPIIHPFASYFLVVYSVLFAMAIFKFQLMDIRVAVKKALVYSIGVAIISGFIIVISFLSSWLAEKIPGLKSWVVPLIAGITAFVVGRIFWSKSQEAEKLKYEFITIAAHKLRTPLTEIKWAAGALQDNKLSKEDRSKLVEEILSADNKLIDLTSELLAVSKAETDKHKYVLEKINLEKAARNVVNSFQYQMREKNIKLIYNAEDNLPMVNADKTRITSVMQTFVENAMHYTKDKIKISIGVYKNNLVFHVEDNGIGIKKEDQIYIFSKFYRSHEAYLTETEGTGIGLFLAKSIIDKHNGKIGVRSEGKGKGSMFWFELPIT